MREASYLFWKRFRCAGRVRRETHYARAIASRTVYFRTYLLRQGTAISTTSYKGSLGNS